MKPCIECGKDCEILPVQLGDIFTLTYLRVCSGECMFLIAYEFMRDISEHKQFRVHLYDKQDEEDNKLRDEYVKQVTDEYLKTMRDDFKVNPNLLSTPVASGIFKMFNASSIPQSSGTTMKFTRPSLEDRIMWQTQHVESLKTKLAQEEEYLKKMVFNG